MTLKVCGDWLVGCIEDLRRFSSISAISRLGNSRDNQSEIQVARPGIEPPDLLLHKPRA